MPVTSKLSLNFHRFVILCILEIHQVRKHLMLCIWSLLYGTFSWHRHDRLPLHYWWLLSVLIFYYFEMYFYYTTKYAFFAWIMNTSVWLLALNLCEWISIDDRHDLERILHYMSTLIIIMTNNKSHHVIGSRPIKLHNLVPWYNKCQLQRLSR